MSQRPSLSAGWRLPLRLARRETRRRPGRTILVALLVAVPVMAMTTAAIVARTGVRGPEFEFAQLFGSADLAVVDQRSNVVSELSSGGERPATEQIDDVLPVGSATTRLLVGMFVPVRAAGDDRLVTAQIAGLVGTPGDLSSFGIESGGVPGPDEVWVSEHVLDRYDLAVGDTLAMELPVGEWTISGAGVPLNDYDADVIVFGELPADQFRRTAGIGSVTLIDLPDDGADARRAATRQLATVVPRSSIVSPETLATDRREPGEVDTSTLAWGWVAGALALAAVGVVIAAAFATSARRQLVTVGQLGANGAPQRVVMRALGLQGFWTGLAGSLAGVVCGIGIGVFGRGTLQRLAGQDLPPTRIAALDLAVIAVTGVLAALVAATLPARSAARVPTLTALAGRRPLSAVPPRLVPIGLALFGVGVLMLVAAANTTNAGNGAIATAVLGGLGVMAGMCCCSPLAIDVMSRATARLGGSRRFAGRSLARTRARSAAIVTAIGVTGAIALAGGSWALSEGREELGGPRSLPDDAVVATSFENESALEAPPDRPVPELVRDQVAEIVPGTTWHPRREVVLGQFVDEGRPSSRRIVLGADSGIYVADEATMDLFELPDEDREALAERGALLLNEWAYGGRERGQRAATIEVTLRRNDGDVTFTAARRAYLLEGERDEYGNPIGDDGVVTGWGVLMVTDEVVADHDLDTVVRGGFTRAGTPLTAGQRERLASVTAEASGESLADTYRSIERSSASTSWNLDWQYARTSDLTLLVQAIILGAAALLVLIVVAIGLSLAATESRDERDVLVAVGAKPSTLRRMAGVKAVVLSFTGLVLAVPTGLVPVWAISGPANFEFAMPWALLGILLVALPVLVGVASWAASSIAQRVRPVRMSTLAVD